MADKAGVQVIDATNPYNLVKVGTFDTGGYACGVDVVGNLAGIAEGDAGFVLIETPFGRAPFLISRPMVEGAPGARRVVFSFPTHPCCRYQIEHKPSLAADWVPVGEPVWGTGQLLSISHSIGGDLKGFYRVEEKP